MSAVDAGRQLFRYSIPGSTFLLAVAIYTFAYRLAWGQSLSGATKAIGDALPTVLALASAVPLGFLLYQAYHFRYAPLALPRLSSAFNTQFVTRDRGAGVLSGIRKEDRQRLRHLLGVRLDVRSDPRENVFVHKSKRRLAKWLGLLELDEAAIKSNYPDADSDLHPVRATGLEPRVTSAREAPEYGAESSDDAAACIYAMNWHENWNVLRAVLNAVNAKHPNSELKREYTTLSDIYHALGASRTAVAAAWGLAVVYNVTAHPERVADHLWQTAVATGIVTAVTAITAGVVLHRTRVKTQHTAEHTLRLGLRWFLASHPEVFDSLHTERPPART